MIVDNLVNAEFRIVRASDSDSYLGSSPFHQLLAMLRGGKEGILSLKLVIECRQRQALLEWILFHGLRLARTKQENSWSHNQLNPSVEPWLSELRSAVEDGMGRLLIPALEREWWRSLTDKAHKSSFQVEAS